VICIDEQILRIMDFSPRMLEPRLQHLDGWQFHADDLKNMSAQCAPAIQ
jgi:hypothetical protein